MKLEQLSENDRAELDKFKLYLTALKRWDDAYDDRPDFAPISDLEQMEFGKKQAKAHMAIYKQIYGDL